VAFDFEKKEHQSISISDLTGLTIEQTEKLSK